MGDVSNYERLRDQAQRYYNGIGRRYSPVLNETIFFPGEGFNHLIYKGSRTEREKSSQVLRFKLLPLAIKLIELSTTHQEFEESLKEFEVKCYKQKLLKTKPVKYWGLIAIINRRKIKVIIRKVGDNGNLHFWSVIPAWVTNRYRDLRYFTTMKGNPEED